MKTIIPKDIPEAWMEKCVKINSEKICKTF